MLEEHIAQLFHRGPVASAVLLIAPMVSIICHHAVVALDTTAYEQACTQATRKLFEDPRAFLRWRIGGRNDFDCRPGLLEVLVPIGTAAFAALSAGWLFS